MVEEVQVWSDGVALESFDIQKETAFHLQLMDCFENQIITKAELLDINRAR